MEDIKMYTNKRFNTVFDALYGMLNNESFITRTSNNIVPESNIIEEEKQFCLEFAVPGLKKEDFSIQLNAENNLTINVESKSDEINERRYLHHGFQRTKFNHNIILPDNIDRDAITARIEDGILYIVLPKLMPQEVTPQVRNISIA